MDPSLELELFGTSSPIDNGEKQLCFSEFLDFGASSNEEVSMGAEESPDTSFTEESHFTFNLDVPASNVEENMEVSMDYSNVPAPSPMGNAAVVMGHSNVTALNEAGSLTAPPQMGNSISDFNVPSQMGNLASPLPDQERFFNVLPQAGNQVSPPSSPSVPSPPRPQRERESAYSYNHHRLLFQHLLSDLLFLTYLPASHHVLASILATYQSKHNVWSPILAGLLAEATALTQTPPNAPSPPLPLANLFNLIATSLNITLTHLVTFLERFLSGNTFHGALSDEEKAQPGMLALRINRDVKLILLVDQSFPDVVFGEGACNALYNTIGHFQMRYFAQVLTEDDQEGVLVVSSFRLSADWPFARPEVLVADSAGQ